MAAAAGVSRQTVSNVVNAPERVAHQTRVRVEAVIGQLGYRPDRTARNLRARRSCLLGYGVNPSPEPNLLLDRFLAALARAASAEGYGVLLFAADESPQSVGAYVDLIATGTVDAFVLTGTNYDDPRPPALARADVPFVTFGRTRPDAPHDWVDVDGAAGTRAAVEHLVERQHRRIAYVGWPPGSVTGDERARGWREGLVEATMEVDAELDLRVDDCRASGSAALEVLLALDDPPTAIVAVSDVLAVAIVGAALRRGLEVGSDLAVVGFDDTSLAALLDPPLTTLRQPLEEAAARIVARLAGLLAGAGVQAGSLLAPELIVRKST